MGSTRQLLGSIFLGFVAQFALLGAIPISSVSRPNLGCCMSACSRQLLMRFFFILSVSFSNEILLPWSQCHRLCCLLFSIHWWHH